MYLRQLTISCALLLPSVPLRAADDPAPPKIPRDVQILRDVGVKTEPAALLAFLRSHTPDPVRRKRVAEWVEQLGDSLFAVRQRASANLRVAGVEALPVLRRAAVDPDPERARRARACLDTLEDPALVEAAARLLAESLAPETVEVLLAYLPQAEKDGIARSIRYCLTVLTASSENPSPAVVACLGDSHPARRAVAATLLRGDRGRKHKNALRRLLADTAPAVRFEAAKTLLEGEDKAAMPVLLALLSEAPLPVAWRAEELLGRLAGSKVPHAPLLGTDASRRRSRAAWERWWRAEEAPSHFAARLRRHRTPQLVFSFDCLPDPERPQGFVALDDELNECWKIILHETYIYDFEVLLSGRILSFEKRFIKDRFAYCIVERERDGTIAWTYELDDDDGAGAATRLPNGNTFIVRGRGSLREVTPEGKTVWSRKDSILAKTVALCCRLPNGEIAAISDEDNRMYILDRAGKVLNSFLTEASEAMKLPVPSYKLSVLPNGHLLLVNSADVSFREFNRKGKKIWEYDNPFNFGPSLLPSGHTLAWRNDKLIKLNRRGKIIQECKGPNSITCAESAIGWCIAP